MQPDIMRLSAVPPRTCTWSPPRIPGAPVRHQEICHHTAKGLPCGAGELQLCRLADLRLSAVHPSNKTPADQAVAAPSLWYPRLMAAEPPPCSITPASSPPPPHPMSRLRVQLEALFHDELPIPAAGSVTRAPQHTHKYLHYITPQPQHALAGSPRDVEPPWQSQICRGCIQGSPQETAANVSKRLLLQ